MPATTERIDTGLYCVHWIGTMTVLDLYAARDGVEALANADGVDRYVLMIDGTQLKQLPYEVKAYLGSITKRMLGIVVLNAPYAGVVIGRIFNKLMPIQAQFFTNRERWIAEAVQIYARHQQAK